MRGKGPRKLHGNQRPVRRREIRIFESRESIFLGDPKQPIGPQIRKVSSECLAVLGADGPFPKDGEKHGQTEKTTAG